MNTYLVLFVVAMSASLVLTPILRRFSERRGWVDEPRDERRVHSRAVPRIGGVAIYASVLLSLGCLLFIDNLPARFLGGNRWQLFAVFAPATLILVVGVYDDLCHLPARLKFAAQGLVGTLFYVLGGRIVALSVPFLGSVHLPPALGFALTVLWVVAITNAFNLIDGMDGLAAGAALFSSVVLFVVSLMLGHAHVVMIALALSGALIGFLRYNFNPASIFLGDSGSMLIGFTLAALSVQGAEKASTAVAVTIPLLAFALPVLDTGLAIVRRFISGRPVFQADREHIHHMLLARGWSQRRVAFVLYGVCAFFGMAALLLVGNTNRETGLVLFVIAAAVVLAVGRLRYLELDELKASMRRNVSERRLRAANNVRVRRASRAMSQAKTLGELLGAVRELLDSSEFVYATVRLGRSSDAARNEEAFAREKGAPTLRGAEIRNGLICWSWERGDVEAAEIIGSGCFWTLRLPLTTGRSEWGYINLYREFGSDALLIDINYLCHLFQKEMARAAERALGARQREGSLPKANALAASSAGSVSAQ
jgi:UDP-GlcNAc:undecaprenyl-phosphate GlcNAc-1-phosphate transferase